MKSLFLCLALAFGLGCAAATGAAEPTPDSRLFETLNVRGTTYTRVTVLEVKKRHVFFKSAQGYATVLIEDLDSSAQAQLRGEARPVDLAPSAPSDASKPAGRVTQVKARENSEADMEEAEEAEDSADSATTREPFRWTLASISGLGVFGLGFLALLVGQVWLIGAAFRTSVGWGVAMLVGTFVADIITIMFCRQHWDTAKRPVCLKLGGVVLVLSGWFLSTR